MENTTPQVEASEKQPVADKPCCDKKSKALLYIVLVFAFLLIIALIAYTAYMYGKESKDEEVPANEANKVVSTTEATATITTTVSEYSYEEWMTYESSEYGYTLKYPSDWKLEESEKVVCDYSEGEGGCYDSPEGAFVRLQREDSKNVLSIEFQRIGATYAYDINKNYEEEDFIFWNSNFKKGYFYCDFDNTPIDCISDKSQNITATAYHDGLDSEASNCESCYYPEGNLSNPCWDNVSLWSSIEIIGRFSDGYSIEEDEVFDKIVSSMTAPTCQE